MLNHFHLNDESFDFVLIKEALHHFPRPYLALYEALRVCRIGVVIFEPNGEEPGVISKILRVLRRRNTNSYYRFEKVGNFQYAPNPRELEKLMLGMDYQKIAFNYYNDYWLNREADAAPLSGGNQEQRSLREKVFKTIRRRDQLSKMSLVPFGKVGCCMFKKEDVEIEKGLVAAGWTVKKLPQNPFR